MKNPWDANIETARESNTENLSEPGYDGNREYDESGTYGQNEYTVRDRGDGTSDVYIVSDSDRGHSHDLIDNETGEVIENYHDYLLYLLDLLNEKSVYGLESDIQGKKIR